MHWWNISQTPRETKRESTNSERKYYQESFQDKLWSRGELGKEMFWVRIWKSCTHQNFLSKNQRERRIDITQRRWIHIPSGRRYSEIVRKKLQVLRIHSKARTNRKERRFQWRTSKWTWRVSTDRINRWRWSPTRLLVHLRELHLASSQWTSSSTPCAERRNILYSSENTSM